jgi:uncharacterized lipoprotein YddW (UPF0748 family)
MQPQSEIRVRPLSTGCGFRCLARANLVCAAHCMKRALCLALTWCGIWLSQPTSAGTVFVPGHASPPMPTREFRGVWVASVNNIDWPSKPTLPAARQQAELTELLDRAVALRLNTVIFQVRCACDALYSSSLEPWSEYLSGEMDQPPRPTYDPLRFAVEEAHRRGLELHAWFNPFRARHNSGKSAAARRHVSRAHPDWVRTYGSQVWLDPGDRAVHDYTLSVILDVLQRYDVDGIHIDDYFYPYTEKNASGADMDFPDEATWKRYQQGGGKLTRNDWRRDNVNVFVHRLYQEVKRRKPWVKVGVSPFGIWRPGFPASVRGLDAYEKLWADSRRWLVSGWLDYCAPQLYWSIEAPNQSLPALLGWWRSENLMHRHVWPGLNVYRAAQQPGELEAEIRLARRESDSPGFLLWSFKPLAQDKSGAAAALGRGLPGGAALVPASPWLDSRPPPRPMVTMDARGADWVLSWQADPAKAVGRWVLQSKSGRGWITEILPGGQNSRRFGAASPPPAVLALRAVDRFGNLSLPAVLERRERTPVSR